MDAKRGGKELDSSAKESADPVVSTFHKMQLSWCHVLSSRKGDENNSIAMTLVLGPNNFETLT